MAGRCKVRSGLRSQSARASEEASGGNRRERRRCKPQVKEPGEAGSRYASPEEKQGKVHAGERRRRKPKAQSGGN